MYINIFSALLLNGDSSFTHAKKPPCELNTFCVLTTAATRALIWPVKYIYVRKRAKNQETLQSCTTPDPGYHMGK